MFHRGNEAKRSKTHATKDQESKVDDSKKGRNPNFSKVGDLGEDDKLIFITEMKDFQRTAETKKI